MNVAKRVGFNSNTCALHIMGGGAYIMRRYLKFDGIDVTWDLDVHSNAKGYEAFCKQSLRKQGVIIHE